MFLLAVMLGVATAAPSATPTVSRGQVEKAVALYFHESHENLPRKYFNRIIPAYKKSSAVMVIYLDGSADWCGSSGCLVLLLELARSGPKVVSDLNAWPPITLDGRSPSGYPRIGVWHHGGGELNPYCEELTFQPNGLPSILETARERAAGHRRCTSSKNLLYAWPKSRRS